ncbi:hypothetical protein LWI29_036269 [Acer saccharum]|uniref:Uncharacterized protein n=1 Tax=Acer saccharum TaxID=4024 RepID=A0AA39SPS4_ACESA|nr:hypothetical protein LWI29_036269 [Acer saccharum]
MCTYVIRDILNKLASDYKILWFWRGYSPDTVRDITQQSTSCFGKVRRGLIICHRLLGLSFRDEYASVAISDEVYTTAFIYGDETLRDKLVDVVQSLKKDFGYDLEGIIVANNNSVVPPVNIHNLMEDLHKKLNFKSFESLKHTCWKDNITPWSSEVKCSRFGYLYCGVTFPLRCSVEKVIPELRERLERTSAQPMLQAFLHVFNTLHMERDKESMGRKKEREGKDEEREEFERRALQHDFNIKMKRYEESKRRKKSKGRNKERVGKDKERVESKRKAFLHDSTLHMERDEESKGRKKSEGRKERVGKDKEREESKRKKRCKIIQ